jgi:amino acid permease
MIALIVPVIIISLIDSYRYLSYLSIPSVILATIGMLMIFYYSFSQFTLGNASTAPLEWFNLSAFFGRIGIAMYLFDGTAIVLNIRGEARDKARYSVILLRAIIFTLLLFICFALICYLVFRDQALPIFSMNLVPINAFVLFILTCVCFNALTSFPI